MTRILLWFSVGVCTVCLLVYGADWAMWRLLCARGRGTDALQVSRVSVTPLKAHKKEYDVEGTDTVTCTQSVLPQLFEQQWRVPCWWLARHRQVVIRY